MGRITEAALAAIEAECDAGLKSHRWLIVPEPWRSTSGKAVTKKELVAELTKSRVVLEHATWEEASNEARRVSTLGGVGLVRVVSIKTTASVMDTYDNGTSTKWKKR